MAPYLFAERVTEFQRMMDTLGALGIDLPGLDFTALAAGHGCPGVRIESADGFAAALDRALQSDGPWVIDAAVVGQAVGSLYEGCSASG